MKKIVTLLLCAMLLSGCTQSNIVNPQNGGGIEGETLEDGHVIIEWDQAKDDARDSLTDSAVYPLVTEAVVQVDEEVEEVLLVLTVQDNITNKEAVKYAMQALKDFNGAVAIQTNEVKLGDDTSYGGVYTIFGASVIVAPESTEDDQSTWIVNEHIDAGEEYRELKAVADSE